MPVAYKNLLIWPHKTVEQAKASNSTFVYDPKTGELVMTCYNRHYKAASTLAKQLLDSGKYVKVTLKVDSLDNSGLSWIKDNNIKREFSRRPPAGNNRGGGLHPNGRPTLR